MKVLEFGKCIGCGAQVIIVIDSMFCNGVSLVELNVQCPQCSEYELYAKVKEVEP